MAHPLKFTITFSHTNDVLFEHVWTQKEYASLEEQRRANRSEATGSLLAVLSQLSREIDSGQIGCVKFNTPVDPNDQSKKSQLQHKRNELMGSDLSGLGVSGDVKYGHKRQKSRRGHNIPTSTQAQSSQQKSGQQSKQPTQITLMQVKLEQIIGGLQVSAMGKDTQNSFTSTSELHKDCTSLCKALLQEFVDLYNSELQSLPKTIPEKRSQEEEVKIREFAQQVASSQIFERGLIKRVASIPSLAREDGALQDVPKLTQIVESN
ncbi:hypothetical protein MP228_000766 [Amoeboaphelidium protococcarum]|nr:hypothetical protein MP228_000766 [Amoeboaphelidium protococcarum]